MIILNLKNYPESIGQNLDKLLQPLYQIITQDPKLNKNLIVTIPTPYLVFAKRTYPKLNICSQHVDNAKLGSTTGSIPADILTTEGIEYTLLNHSEKRILPENYIAEVQTKGIKVIACCENLDEASTFVRSGAWAIAFEPKELIGSGISVTTQPEMVRKFVALIADKSISLVGAGVSNANDVIESQKLGAKGVLLASAFVKSDNPYAKAKELLSAISTL
jgi:triosephosphate isomerase